MDHSKVDKVIQEYEELFIKCKRLTSVLKLDDEFTQSEIERLKRTVWNARNLQIAQSEMNSKEALLFKQKLFELIHKHSTKGD